MNGIPLLLLLKNYRSNHLNQPKSIISLSNANHHAFFQLTRSFSSYVFDTKPKKVCFLGPPGVGKGTYAAKIAPILGVPTISTGDIVRQEIKENSLLGRKIQAYNDKGLLVPDEIVMEMVKKKLQKDDAKGGYIFDGFPRTIVQAEAFQKIAPFTVVMNICLPDWILVEKILGRRVCSECNAGYNVADINHEEYQMPPLSPKQEGICDICGGNQLIARIDDTKEIISNRLQIYHNETSPLISFYQKLGVLRNFHVKKGLADLDKLIDALLRN